MGRLEGKVAIVTGAASGIGRASAILFAREGARIVIVDQKAEALNDTAKAMAQYGSDVQTVAADTSNEDDVKAYIDRAVTSFGGLDVVYANAGISGGLVPPPLLEQTVENWLRVLRVNLVGTFLAIKHAAPHMIAKGRGSIILTASVAGLRANAGGAPYSASKAGVISLAQTAANSLLGTGVRVNAICPGLIETGMTRELFERARERGTQTRSVSSIRCSVPAGLRRSPPWRCFWPATSRPTSMAWPFRSTAGSRAHFLSPGRSVDRKRDHRYFLAPQHRRDLKQRKYETNRNWP